MAVTIAPSVEAAQAIVDRINAATTYALEVVAQRQEIVVDHLEEVSELRVDVVHEEETQLEETLDDEDRTSHEIRIYVRSKVPNRTADEIDPLKLLTRQIFQQVNEYETSNGRVKVWQCDIEPRQAADKELLRQHGIFVAAIMLRVEVEPS